MHIAICDDNVADRKQLERLLGRQKLHIVDSFGHTDALLSNPRQYDMFFLDMNNPEDLSTGDLIARLQEAGICAPIVLCCSKTNYRIQNLPDHLYYLDKPIKNSELIDMLDDASRALHKLPTPLEISTRTETFFLLEEEIISIEQEKDGLAVYATGKRQFLMYGNAIDFFNNCCQRRSCFYLLNKNTILNGTHIKEIKPFSVIMDNGRSYRHFLQKEKLSCYLSK